MDRVKLDGIKLEERRLGAIAPPESTRLLRRAARMPDGSALQCLTRALAFAYQAEGAAPVDRVRLLDVVEALSEEAAKWAAFERRDLMEGWDGVRR